jgi:phosphoribosylformylglycinamidine synthase
VIRVAVVRFPGSNCDEDSLRAVDRAGGSAHYVWHRDTDLAQADAVLIPGGFAYGDYLRAGAIARFSPVMGAVIAHAEAGGPVIGICNGFQVLCEAGLLPGALMRNAGLRFVSRPVDVRVESTDTPCTGSYAKGDIITAPVAHGEGRFVAGDDTLRELEAEGRVVFRYVGANPNGSMADIAGICNRERNVVGLMPHPERAASPLLGNASGAGIFVSLMQCVQPLRGGSA